MCISCQGAVYCAGILLPLHLRGLCLDLIDGQICRQWHQHVLLHRHQLHCAGRQITPARVGVHSNLVLGGNKSSVGRNSQNHPDFRTVIKEIRNDQ